MQLVAELLRQRYRANLQEVPFLRNWNEVIPTVMRGELKLAVLGVPFGIQQVRAGKMKALAVTGPQRSKFLPQVPSFEELGLAGFRSGGWYALFAPRGAPQALVDRLAAGVAEVHRAGEFAQDIERVFAEPAVGSAQELAALVASETARIGELIKAPSR